MLWSLPAPMKGDSAADERGFTRINQCPALIRVIGVYPRLKSLLLNAVQFNWVGR
jgi:hypothetical protein